MGTEGSCSDEIIQILFSSLLFTIKKKLHYTKTYYSKLQKLIRYATNTYYIKVKTIDQTNRKNCVLKNELRMHMLNAKRFVQFQ